MTDTPREPQCTGKFTDARDCPVHDPALRTHPGDARRLLVEKWRTEADTLDRDTGDNVEDLCRAGRQSALLTCADELEAALSPEAVPSEVLSKSVQKRLEAQRGAVPSAPAGLRALGLSTLVEQITDIIEADGIEDSENGSLYVTTDARVSITKLLAATLQRAEDTP